MGLFDRLRGYKSQSTVRVVNLTRDNFYSWNGNVYSSDIVRAALAPYVKAIGKLLATHIRQNAQSGDTRVNPDAYMKFLLEEPNPYMSGQKLQERMAAQLKISKNAFALIERDSNGFPVHLWPIACSSAEALEDATGKLFIRFTMERNGQLFTFPYSDLVHLSEDVSMGSVFGNSLMPALAPLMNIVTTTDQGLVNAVKNSGVIRWLLTFKQKLRPEDMKKATQDFASQFLSIDNGTGVAAVDTSADAVQIQPHDYVPNTSQAAESRMRIYALLNTNEKIVNSAWNETEWASYFEAEIEPTLIAMQNEWTRKLFTRRERAAGNRILFDASSIDSMTAQTKLSFVQMVSRRSLTPNEWRAMFHWAPLEGGDEPLFWQDPGANASGDAN